VSKTLVGNYFRTQDEFVKDFVVDYASCFLKYMFEINLFISGPFPVCNLSEFLTCVQRWESKSFTGYT